MNNIEEIYQPEIIDRDKNSHCDVMVFMDIYHSFWIPETKMEDIDVIVHEFVEVALCRLMPDETVKFSQMEHASTVPHIITSLVCKSGYSGRKITPKKFEGLIFTKRRRRK